MPSPVTEHHFCPDPSDLALDKAIAARVFGHSLTDGPNNALPVTAGAGRAARLVELLPVSTDLTATSKAVSVAFAAGHADGLHTGVMRQPDGSLEYRASFLRLQVDGPIPICGADADTMPRAICAALLALYGEPARAPVPGAMLYWPHSRVLQ